MKKLPHYHDVWKKDLKNVKWNKDYQKYNNHTTFTSKKVNMPIPDSIFCFQLCCKFLLKDMFRIQGMQRVNL